MAGTRSVCRAAAAGSLGLLLVLSAPASAPAAIATLETGVTGAGGHARTPFDKTSQRKVVRTRVGVPRDPLTYVVYTRFNVGTGKTEVILARSQTTFLSDSEKLVLFGSGGAAWANSSDSFAYPAIDISADGKELHVVALNSSQTDVVYTKNVSIEGAAWQTAWTQAGGGTSPRYDVVSTSPYGTSAPSIALDENRRPHVVWTRPALASPFAPNVFYARHDGAAWSGESPLSSITTGTAFPEELDPSIDIANGWVHVLYKDDQDTGDATPKTDRFRYVRNTNQFVYSAYYAPVTVMQPAAAQNDLGQPGSIAAQGNDVWVTGSFLGGFSNVGYFNYSTTRRRLVGDRRPGHRERPLRVRRGREGPRADRAQLPREPITGSTRSAGTAAPSTPTSGAGATWVDGLGGTCASHSSYVVTGVAATQPDDSLHLSVLKRKLTRDNELAYCWYNSLANASPGADGRHDLLRLVHRGHPLPGTPDVPPLDRHAAGLRVGHSRLPDLHGGPRHQRHHRPRLAHRVGSGTQWRTANRGPGDVFRVRTASTTW